MNAVFWHNCQVSLREFREVQGTATTHITPCKAQKRNFVNDSQVEVIS